MKYNEKYDRFIDDDLIVYRWDKFKDKLVQCKISKNNSGYLWVSIKGKNRYPVAFHRFIWETFNGEIQEGYEIDHIDGNKQNNDISNLRCVTHKGNMNNIITKSKISASKLNNTNRRGKTYSDFGRKFKEHFGFAGNENRLLYLKEWQYNKRHNKCRWEIINEG